jgi:hypothetical protein
MRAHSIADGGSCPTHLSSCSSIDCSSSIDRVPAPLPAPFSILARAAAELTAALDAWMRGVSPVLLDRETLPLGPLSAGRRSTAGGFVVSVAKAVAAQDDGVFMVVLSCSSSAVSSPGSAGSETLASKSLLLPAITLTHHGRIAPAAGFARSSGSPGTRSPRADRESCGGRGHLEAELPVRGGGHLHIFERQTGHQAGLMETACKAHALSLSIRM